MTDTPQRRPQLQHMHLAAQALHYARLTDWTKSTEVLNRIGELGHDAQMVLIYGAADSAIAAQFPGGRPPQGAILAPLWHKVDLGTSTTSADDVPPDIRWVGQFLTARAALDKDMCIALIQSATTDDEWSRRVSRLVQMCALTINDFIGAPA